LGWSCGVVDTGVVATGSKWQSVQALEPIARWPEGKREEEDVAGKVVPYVVSGCVVVVGTGGTLEPWQLWQFWYCGRE
jgi:hypothetical protein